MAIQENIANAIAKDTAHFLQPSSSSLAVATNNSIDANDIAKAPNSSDKSRFIAFLLCFPPIGFFGIHRFYVGRPNTGVLYVCTLGLVLFGWIIDFILILSGLFADGKGKPIRLWRPNY